MNTSAPSTAVDEGCAGAIRDDFWCALRVEIPLPCLLRVLVEPDQPMAFLAEKTGLYKVFGNRSRGCLCAPECCEDGDTELLEALGAESAHEWTPISQKIEAWRPPACSSSHVRETVKTSQWETRYVPGKTVKI